MDHQFSEGDRVRVSDKFFWAQGASGTVGVHPQQDQGDRLAWEENSALGINIVHWVWFDEPQFDAEGEGPYRAGQIWRSALSRLIADPSYESPEDPTTMSASNLSTAAFETVWDNPEDAVYDKL